MAPYLAENQGLAKQQRPPLGVRKELPTSLNANTKLAATPPHSKPTIRVIHIFAPKVIKTDMANFRSTVQKLTGRSTKKSRARSSTKVTPTTSAPHHPMSPPPALHPASVHSPEDLILHRLVGDACGGAPLARSTSIDSSSTYSCDSKDTTDANFSFYVPAHRESAYSLSEIPAPFFGAESMVTPTLSSYDNIHLPALQQLPAPHMMDPGLLSFDVDNLGSGLGSPLPLSEHSVGACDMPFLYLEVMAPRPVGGCMIC